MENKKSNLADRWMSDSLNGGGAEVFGTVGAPPCADSEFEELAARSGRWIAPWIAAWILQNTSYTREDILGMDEKTLNDFAEQAKVLLNPDSGTEDTL